MYSFMAGGLFCASVGNILLVVCTATDYWVQYRLQGTLAHQGLWRYCLAGKCYMQMENIAYWNATRAFMILSALSCFAGIITGILSFAHPSTFERFNRSFAAGIMFFISSKCLPTAAGTPAGHRGTRRGPGRLGSLPSSGRGVGSSGESGGGG
uniref:Lens intrinsic membrane protein 2 n=1 Tax=Chelydra serpentina TaxID=8475 RepID=A0A8C3S5X7_CHESE